MKLLALTAAAVAFAASLGTATSSQAETAFQSWAQGRGVYVPSKERLSTFQDDLAIYGVAPPPAESPNYRWHRLQERYGVVGNPGTGDGY